MYIRVRPIDHHDWPRLRNIFLDCRRALLPTAMAENLQPTDLDQQTQGETILVAEAVSSDNAFQQVGFISIQEADDFVHHLMVDAKMHGMGIGRQLLHNLPNWGPAKYRLKCLRSNTQAAAFYLACGFISVGTGIDGDSEYDIFQFAARDCR